MPSQFAVISLLRCKRNFLQFWLSNAVKFLIPYTLAFIAGRSAEGAYKFKKTSMSRYFSAQINCWLSLNVRHFVSSQILVRLLNAKLTKSRTNFHSSTCDMRDLTFPIDRQSPHVTRSRGTNWAIPADIKPFGRRTG